MSEMLWEGSGAWKKHTRLQHYLDWLNKHKGLQFDNYDALWEWSVSDLEGFWGSLWEYFDILGSPYEQVVTENPMPGAKWFTGSRLNYAEHIFRQSSADRPALIFKREGKPLIEMAWAELEQKVAATAAYLHAAGIEPGDRVVAFLPNIPEATIAFLAANSLGATWSSTSPDFGADSVVERFQQIQPKVLFAVDGYQYGGKPFSKTEVVQQIVDALPTLEKVVLLPYLDSEAGAFIDGADLFETVVAHPHHELSFEQVPFEHPIWVLYSSGTTGKPKAITHSHGGVLMEHLKYMAFHNDTHPGERFFWFTTTGWMMWNFLQASLLSGATMVLYDGSPGYPDMDALWQLTEEAGIHHFGTSAPYLVACMKKELQPGKTRNLNALRSVSSTGAPLPPEAFDYVYEHIKSNVWLASMSGGTDVCTAFVGGVATEPVYKGEIQRRGLGCAMYAFDDHSEPIVGEVGEMVITQPMPSMPIYFWNDPEHARYRASYFEMYPGIWRHGDWLLVTERNTLVILGRSDATLNRQGIRIGTAEIYRCVDQIPGIKDSLIVNLELEGGRHYMPLFVCPQPGHQVDEEMIKTIAAELRAAYSPRHVPDACIEVPDIPYTISGKKLEAPVKKILMGIHPEKAANPGAMRNPESLQFFLDFRKKVEEM
ncbi:MAG: acetoacetate--CoA ligase [Bacteroidota bacterium]